MTRLERSRRGSRLDRRGRFIRPTLTPAVAWLVVATVVAASPEVLRVIPVVRGERLLISFELTGGVPAELQAAIESGLRTTFTYTIELKLDVPAWIDPTVASAVVAQSVQYDTLWRRYHLARSVDGRVEAAEVTSDRLVAWRWLTTLDRLPLFPTSLLELNREYYVRVRLRTRPATTFPWPWAGGPSGQGKFTFLP